MAELRRTTARRRATDVVGGHTYVADLPGGHGPTLGRGTRATGDSGGRIARASDALLDFGLLAFAAWTLIYHACLYAHVHAVWAAVGEAVLLIPCAWIAARRTWPPDRAAAVRPTAIAAGRRPDRRRRIAIAVTLLAALAAAIAIGWLGPVWGLVWPLWLIAAVAAILATTTGERPLRGRGWPGPARGQDATAGGTPRRDTLVALAWAVALAILSLFIVRPDTDDTQYVHLSAWIAAHGSFPLRDTMFTNGVLPALFYPPVPSWEAMLGTLARGIPVPLLDLVYLIVVPLASVASVLALWRLLRTWRVPLVGVALTVAILFLLFDARGHWMPGANFIGRIWQGKVVFVSVVVPLAFALLQEQVERPTRRGLTLLAATGVAGVGLTTTSIFTLPILAFASLLPTVRRQPRRSLAAFAAIVAYPLIIGAATLAVGGRNPDEYTAPELEPLFLVHHAFGIEQFAAACLFAALVAAVAIPRKTAARMVACVALVVGLLYSPGVPAVIYDLTGLGRVLWRLTWVLPVAAGVGALAVWPLARARHAILRTAPPAAVCALILLFGAPLWSAGADGTIAGHPAWKMWQDDVADAEAILHHAGRTATVLAPQPTSQAILALSGTVKVVNPLDRYVANLKQFRARKYHGRFHPRARQRQLLEHFIRKGLVALSHQHHDPVRYLHRALRQLGVDIACIYPGHPSSDAAMDGLGWQAVHDVPSLRCWLAP